MPATASICGHDTAPIRIGGEGGYGRARPMFRKAHWCSRRSAHASGFQSRRCCMRLLGPDAFSPAVLTS
eukprot:366402-Chlamydomonas_euryale.AAC.9